LSRWHAVHRSSVNRRAMPLLSAPHGATEVERAPSLAE
jgi:hypothetical protein